MAKLKPASVGLALGLMLAILYTIRAIVLLLFPNFAVNVAKKVVNNVISIQPPVITSDSYVIGVVVVFIAGLVWGIIFSWVYNLVSK